MLLTPHIHDIQPRAHPPTSCAFLQMNCTQRRHPSAQRGPLFRCHRGAAMLLCYSTVTCKRQMVLYSFGHFMRAENLSSVYSGLAVSIHVFRVVSCALFMFVTCMRLCCSLNTFCVLYYKGKECIQTHLSPYIPRI